LPRYVAENVALVDAHSGGDLGADRLPAGSVEGWQHLPGKTGVTVGDWRGERSTQIVVGDVPYLAEVGEVYPRLYQRRAAAVLKPQ
jgi:hypothetical protein